MKFCTASHIESGKQWFFCRSRFSTEAVPSPHLSATGIDQKVLLTLAVLYRIHSPNVELL
jgi:hypothetical protein